MTECRRGGSCELDENPSSGSKLAVWQCINCGFTVEINPETYKLFNPMEGKCRCPRCAHEMIAVDKGWDENDE